MLLSTRSRWPQVAIKFHFRPISAHLTTKLASPATSSKNFRLRRSKVPLRGTANAYRHPHWAAFAADPSAVNAHFRPTAPTPEFLEPAARSERRKKSLHSKTHTRRLLCGALLVVRSSIEPASERPTCSRTRAPISDSRRSAQREAPQSTKRSTAKHGVISGGEQARVRTSCRHLGIELRIASAARYQNFPPAALRSCARGA